MTHDEMIDVIDAHRKGHALQFRDKAIAGDQWEPLCVPPSWAFNRFEYRITPTDKRKTPAWSDMNSRDLDGWLAEHVAGWARINGKHPNEHVRCKTASESDQVWWKRPNESLWECGVCWDIPPHYTTDCGEALKLIDSIDADWRLEKVNGKYVVMISESNKATHTNPCNTIAGAITSALHSHFSESGIFGA